MIENVVIIAPELKPGAGGVGDYTLRLLENLPLSKNLKLLIPRTGLNEAASRQYCVEELGTDRAAILDQLPASGGKALVQYSAYGFDRLGYPRDLIHVLLEWKKQTRGRLVVMFHEIWTFWPVTNKNFFVQLFHRCAIKRLLECADVVFTSTSSQGGHLNKLVPSRVVQVLPVGSNIPHKVDVDLLRKPGWAIIFGLQRTRLRALKRMQHSLSSLAAARHITKIISVGANSDSEINDEERELLAGLRLAEGFEQRGTESEQTISEMLSRASLGIFAQDELSYGKSGSFMAYAAHELSILADFADQSKPEPLCWLIAPRELLEGISQTELKTRGERLRQWQQRTSSWQLISAKVAEALQLNATGRLHVPTASR